ncbi:MAG: hypothetical protein HC842_03060 [Cytophagales bacterium]|nr:hypothetical protein [Cytophagales bacterium]
MNSIFKPRSLKQDLDRVSFLEKLKGTAAPLVNRYVILFILSVGLGLLTVWALEGTGMTRESRLMAGIFVTAALLWVTEALPLFATALFIIGLEIFLISNPGNWPGIGFGEGTAPSYKTFLAPMADPVIFLFLGGFLLAQASVKEGVDKALASTVLSLFGKKPFLSCSASCSFRRSFPCL